MKLFLNIHAIIVLTRLTISISNEAVCKTKFKNEKDYEGNKKIMGEHIQLLSRFLVVIKSKKNNTSILISDRKNCVSL